MARLSTLRSCQSIGAYQIVGSAPSNFSLTKTQTLFFTVGWFTQSGEISSSKATLDDTI